MNAKELAENYVAKRREQLEKELNEMNEVSRRVKGLAGIINTLPKKVLNGCNLRFYGYGRYTSVDVRPKYNERFTEHDTILITEWCVSQDKWEFKKEPDGIGGFKHCLSRIGCGYRYGRYEIEFDSIDNVDGCELIEVTETREVTTYKVKC